MAKWFETAYGTAFVRGGKDSDTLQERIDEKVEELRSNTIDFNLINIPWICYNLLRHQTSASMH